MYYPCDPRKVIESKWQHRATHQETCVADMDAWNDHDVLEHLHKIECPIFLFKGEADYHVTERAVMDTIAAIPNGLAEGGIARDNTQLSNSGSPFLRVHRSPRRVTGLGLRLAPTRSGEARCPARVGNLLSGVDHSRSGV